MVPILTFSSCTCMSPCYPWSNTNQKTRPLFSVGGPSSGSLVAVSWSNRFPGLGGLWQTREIMKRRKSPSWQTNCWTDSVTRRNDEFCVYRPPLILRTWNCLESTFASHVSRYFRHNACAPCFPAISCTGAKSQSWGVGCRGYLILECLSSWLQSFLSVFEQFD